MKCPYCGKEMEKGLIHGRNEINWIKGEKRRIFASSEIHNDAVVLSELSFMKGSAVVAYNCKDCKKILIDYSDEMSDLNKR